MYFLAVQNFLALNKMSVCGRRVPTNKPDNQINRRLKPIETLSQTSDRLAQQQLQRKKGEKEHHRPGNGPIHEETVTISKNYLEQLMRESFMKDKLRLASQSLTERRSQQRGNDEVVAQKHLELTPSDIPGLREYQQRDLLPYPENHKFTALELTDQHRWLIDLAAQVEQNKRLWERRKPPGESDSGSDRNQPVAMENATKGGTYHRGTTNRPTHPSMKSNVANIVFGGEGGGMMRDLSNGGVRGSMGRQWGQEPGKLHCDLYL